MMKQILHLHLHLQMSAVSVSVSADYSQDYTAQRQQWLSTIHRTEIKLILRGATIYYFPRVRLYDTLEALITSRPSASLPHRKIFYYNAYNLKQDKQEGEGDKRYYSVYSVYMEKYYPLWMYVLIGSNSFYVHLELPRMF